MPLYLKLAPYQKFKTFFLSSGMVLVADIAHIEIKLIANVTSEVILPYCRRVPTCSSQMKLL